VWHRALNCGFKVTASAGEDSILNLHATPILGSSRLYAYLGDTLTWEGWVEAVRRGRTFVTNAPLLTLEVDGRIPGDEVAATDSVEVFGKVESIVPLERLELFFNGEVRESIPVGGRRAEFRKRIPIGGRSGWFTLRASNPKPQHPIDDSYIVGETSPVYVNAGKPIRSRADAEYFLKWIDDITRQAREHAGWRSERERSHVLGQFEQARRIMEQRAKEAQ
jgi:hypothetical protein